MRGRMSLGRTVEVKGGEIEGMKGERSGGNKKVSMR